MFIHLNLAFSLARELRISCQLQIETGHRSIAIEGSIIADNALMRLSLALSGKLQVGG